ncbi:30S ribosomal protein S4 [Candidatus Daviesbacteria bacterium]|nr:30S ribosomal protein S4 [Candidatus Daviesbacteria bacterium]
MSRYTGPKRRLSRREGIALTTKDAKFIERKGAVPPGQRGTRTRIKRLSEFGLQLREKQKAKRIYGLTEKQFRNTFTEAAKSKGATGQKLLELLETRLDNLVYKLGFALSRAGARQTVSHGHIRVDNKKVTIPSFKVKVNSVVAISPKFVDNIQVKKSLEANPTLPDWLERKATVGKVLRAPNREEMEQSVSEQLIVEYYSR